MPVVVLAIYLPALVFAFIAKPDVPTLFRTLLQRRGEKVRDQIYPQNMEDWDARYATRPLQWLLETLRLLRTTTRIAGQHQEDADLENLRAAGARWAAAAIVAAIAGILGAIYIVSIR